MHRQIPPLPADALTLVQIGGGGSLPEPWGWVENLEAIRFVDADADTSGPPGVREIGRTIASRSGPVTLHRTHATAASSLLPPNESFLRPLETEGAFDVVRTTTVEAATLDASLAKLGVKQVDVLDLDAPGRELEVLEGAFGTLAGSLFAVEADVALNPIYDGQPLAGEVDSLLRRAGYELVQFLPRRLPRTAGRGLLVLGRGQPVWAEALYFKGLEAAVAALDDRAEAGAREAALGRFVSVCLLYGFGDYALDLVDSTALPVAVARRLRRTILRYDAHIDRSVPARFGQEHGRQLQPIDAWLGELNPAPAPGRTHVTLELEQARRLFRVAGTSDVELAERLREALDWGIDRLRDERREKRRRRGR